MVELSFFFLNAYYTWTFTTAFLVEEINILIQSF